MKINLFLYREVTNLADINYVLYRISVFFIFRQSCSMKRLLLFLITVCFFSTVKGQLLPLDQPEQDACHALELCGNTFTTSFSYQGIGVVSDLTNTPCQGGENNSMWMRLNVVTGGIIVFNIIPLNNADDYDFVVVDITNASCSTFTQSDVIRCNFNNNLPVFNNGMLGLNTTSTLTSVTAGTTGSSYLQQINANAGDVYLIMINNFGQGTSGASPTAGFTIDFTGTTATFNGPTPAMASIIPSCSNAQQIILQMNHNILCNSIEPGGSDFSVAGATISSVTGINCTGSNGYTDKIIINFASALPPGNYNLVANVGTDGNTLLNTCNIPLPANSSIPFIVDPYEAPAYKEVIQPACSEIKIALNKRVSCSSIAGNGSDFSISGPQSANVVTAYGVGCDTTNFTDTVVIVLQPSLITDGTYTITSKKGDDNSTLTDSCSLQQAVGNTITFNINSYDGQLVAPLDTVLCAAQYLQLAANSTAPPPPMPVLCGSNNVGCSGNSRIAFVGGKDSVSIENSPFFGSSEDFRAQYLFRASELREMGLKQGIITSLQWKVTQKLSSFPFSGFTIKMGCTALSDMPTTYSVALQTVYTNASYTTNIGWNTFQLTTPFSWDGSSNLIVEVCFDNNLSSANDEVVHGATPFISVLQRSAFGSSGCAITTQGVLGPFRDLRPKIRFGICEPAPGIAQYIWSPGTLLSDSTIQNPIAYVNNNIAYNVTMVDKYGCAHRDSTVITMSVRSVDVNPRDTTICYGDKVALVATGGLRYEWLADDPSSLSCNDCSQTIAAPKQTSVYTVIFNDQYNCKDTLQSLVNVNQLPPVNITQDDQIVKYGSTIQLIVNGAYLYSWYPLAHISDPNLSTPLAFITEPTTFYVIGIDTNGCRNTDSVKIGVDYGDAVFIPSAFTPNGDGKNDVFRVGSISFQKLNEFRVFNRWGQEIFSTTNAAKGWDGSFQGVPQDPGVYQYIIRLAYPDGKIETYKGNVTLIR